MHHMFYCQNTSTIIVQHLSRTNSSMFIQQNDDADELLSFH